MTLTEAIHNELDDIHVCLPGKIVAWDGKAATVKPSMPRALSNGGELAAPQIVSVPVLFPTGLAGSAMISLPLQSGDDVLLYFSEVALDSWLSGSDAAPDDPRRFDMSDCFAAPMLRPTVAAADTANLRLLCGASSFVMSPGGEVTLNATKFQVNAPQSEFSDVVTAQGQINGNGGMAVQGGSGATFSGNITQTGGSYTTDQDVIASGKSLSTHTHPGDSGGTTGAPQ